MIRVLPKPWGSAARCFTTITTQSTVSRVPAQDIVGKTPDIVRSTTVKTAPKKATSTSVKEQIVNLQRSVKLFKDENGVFSKISSLEKIMRTPEAPIRIGIIGSKPSLLNTILADPFASDQTWYEALQDRPKGAVLRYNEQFEIAENTIDIPAPILSTQNIELIELEIDQLTYNDGCHLYLNFGEAIDTQWPTYNFQDEEDFEIPGADEINSKISLEAINLLRESPLNSTVYTKLYNQSNFPQFNKTLSKLIQPEVVVTKLFNSIVKNFQIQNIQNSLTLEELNLKDSRIRGYIAQWDESAHREFQTKFQPYVTDYESKNLAWWKLYYKNDDIEGILANMLHQGFLNDSLKNFSYVKGQIDSFSSFNKNGTEPEVKVLGDISQELDQNALTQLKNKIIGEDLVPIQNFVAKLLLLNFVGLQLPVALVAVGGYWFYDFSLYSMFGLGSLGLVLGFNNISKKWLSTITNFKKDLFESTRLGIFETNKQLYQHWEEKYEIEKKKILERLELIEELQK